MTNPIFDKHYIGYANKLNGDSPYLDKYIEQYKKQGWDDTTLHSLNSSLAQWLLPKLKRFKEIGISHPSTLTAKDWNVILDKIIFAMEAEVNDTADSEDSERAKEGARLLGEYFFDLWS